jgi:hypothetical protein
MSLKDKHGFECMKNIGIVLNQQHVGHSFAPERERAATASSCRKRDGWHPWTTLLVIPLALPLFNADVSMRRKPPMARRVLYCERAVVEQHCASGGRAQTAYVFNNQKRALGWTTTCRASSVSAGCGAVRFCAVPICRAGDVKVLTMGGVLRTLF